MIGEYLQYRRLRALHAMSSQRVWVDQVLGLRALMKRLFDVPFYGDRLRKIGTKPGDLRTVKDLAMMPSTSAEAFASELRRRASGGGAPSRTPIVFDAGGRVAPVSLGVDARARRLHLFAVLAAWRVGVRERLLIDGDGFGEEGAPSALLFRTLHAQSADARARAVRGASIVEPGALAVALYAAGRGSHLLPSQAILRGAPIPGDLFAALGGADQRTAATSAPRAILGDALFGPLAWQCTAGAFHPIAARAVIEAVTGESAARGLTGGSRSSRAPREAGALHVTLLEESELPVFRVELGLRGRIHPAGCACGALTNRLELEIPFLGPLFVIDGDSRCALDPLAILRAAAAVPFPVTRVALIQDDAQTLRVLAALGDAAGESAAPAAAAARAAIEASIARITPPATTAVHVAVGAATDLPFPERGFVRGLEHGPLLSTDALAESEARTA
ncbi:MAG: hypothetical protein ACKVU1_18050 [bacterium]